MSSSLWNSPARAAVGFSRGAVRAGRMPTTARTSTSAGLRSWRRCRASPGRRRGLHTPFMRASMRRRGAQAPGHPHRALPGAGSQRCPSRAYPTTVGIISLVTSSLRAAKRLQAGRACPEVEPHEERDPCGGFKRGVVAGRPTFLRWSSRAVSAVNGATYVVRMAGSKSSSSGAGHGNCARSPETGASVVRGAGPMQDGTSRLLGAARTPCPESS
jgi:hypothetical protein